jgi:hypothetical protein
MMAGKGLWTTALPASPHAFPIIYEVGGKLFIGIPADGSRWP